MSVLSDLLFLSFFTEHLPNPRIFFDSQRCREERQAGNHYVDAHDSGFLYLLDPLRGRLHPQDRRRPHHALRQRVPATLRQELGVLQSHHLRRHEQSGEVDVHILAN